MTLTIMTLTIINLTITTHDYDFQDMVSPNYGHYNCTILYPLHNLNCKHRTRTLPNYNKYIAFLLIVRLYEKDNYCYDKKKMRCNLI